jgi:hypothetical protein
MVKIDEKRPVTAISSKSDPPQERGTSVPTTEDRLVDSEASAQPEAPASPVSAAIASPENQPQKVLFLPPEIVTRHIAPLLDKLSDLSKLESIFYGKGSASQVYDHLAPAIFINLTGKDDSKKKHVLELVEKKLDDTAYNSLVMDFPRHLRAAALINAVAPESPLMNQIGFERDEFRETLGEALETCESIITRAYAFACRKGADGPTFKSQFFSPLQAENNAAILVLAGTLVGDGPNRIPVATRDTMLSSVGDLFTPFLDYVSKVGAPDGPPLQASVISHLLDNFLSMQRQWLIHNFSSWD